jgi:hypothetical protein
MVKSLGLILSESVRGLDFERLNGLEKVKGKRSKNKSGSGIPT